MTLTERAALLKGWALEVGFDRAGVATLEPVARGAVFLRWLARGEHAGMGYLEQRVEERLEPARVLAGARSVLCVALRYHPLAEVPEPAGDLWPGVARYARGRDYHNLMVKRLRKLARRIRQAFPGTDTRNYVDTGPVLERELAARAGLGVAGKNTCLLDREGSWFVLGELFLTLDLQPDSPLADLCGRCTRCLDACPTGALREPYRLDASRCISYWTIEHRGAIPEPWRGRLDGWVFGCDVCQEVCPWNLRESPPAERSALAVTGERAGLDLIGLLALAPAEYQQRFPGSALQRAGLAGLQRNAALAMAHRGEPRYLAPLARALAENPQPVVRGHAAWALGQLGGEPARQALAAALDAEADGEVRAEIAAALARLGEGSGGVGGQGLGKMGEGTSAGDVSLQDVSLQDLPRAEEDPCA